MRSQKNGLAKGGFFSNLRYDAKKNPMLLVMMIPSVAFFLVFNYLPMVGIYYAFTDYNVRKGLFGSRLSDIRTVLSHPQALAQCSTVIKGMGWKSEELLNTAFAAERVALLKDHTVAFRYHGSTPSS